MTTKNFDKYMTGAGMASLLLFFSCAGSNQNANQNSQDREQSSQQVPAESGETHPLRNHVRTNAELTEDYVGGLLVRSAIHYPLARPQTEPVSSTSASSGPPIHFPDPDPELLRQALSDE